MIAYVEGRALEIMENACLVVTEGGVGYEVFLTGHDLARLPEKGGRVSFYCFTEVREDALELYGFGTRDERETFRILTSISRVGARTAMNILTVFRPDDLRSLIVEDDPLSLTRVSGIGKKTGQQIFLELKYKLKLDGAAKPGAGAALSPGSALKDAVAGLMNLGYPEEDSITVVKKALSKEPDLDVASLLRAALKLLAKARQ